MNPKMKNAELIRVLEGLGYENVRSVISSGNFIFGAKKRGRSKLEAEIETALLDHLGAPCTTMVRTAEEFESLTQSMAFEDFNDGPTDRCNVTFLKRKPKSVPKLPRHANDKYSSVLAIENLEVFSVIDTTSAKTPDLMSWLEKEFGKEITTRTWKTVHRIVKALSR